MMKKLCLPALVVLSISLAACSSPGEVQDVVGDEIELAEGPTYPIVDTGQIICYDADGKEIACPAKGEPLYGQDAQFGGNAFSLTDNGDETVVDNVTGLMWQQVPSADGFSWTEAVDYCNDLELGGYDDWRVPSAKELFSISDFESGWPYLDTVYFKLASGEVSKDEQYWTSDEYVGVTVEGGSEAVFGVNHVTGHIKAYAAGGPPEDGAAPPQDSQGPPPGEDGSGPTGGSPADNYVRAVRGADYGVNDYVDNGDGTVTDEATGLMWAQADSVEGMDWEAALAWAESTDLAGYDDWRLPNVKELQSIVDYSYAPGATDSSRQGAAIDPLFESTPFTNEAGEDDYGYYWTSTSAPFRVGEPYYYAWYVAFGRAVNAQGLDFHGAGAVRFDTKYEGGPLGEGGERYLNLARLVRDDT
ncbi:MAG: DUF1566 domain-containing protein [Coriobacteriia bacterium]|nr:DUF1566 domain-containing protein [Coriobacteriia bacterium]